MNIDTVTNDDTILLSIGKTLIIQPIDPFSCVIKLAMLSYKPVNTKLSFQKNKIWFQVPNLIQGVKRWILNDQKDDLHTLYYPLRRSCEFYHTFTEKKELDYIFDVSMKGILQLIQTYEEHPLVLRCLSY